jgi:hypothetical protein
MQAIPGLQYESDVEILKHRTFESLQHSLSSLLASWYEPGGLNTMLKSFNDLKANSNYHDQIVSHAQSLMFRTELVNVKIVCHGLQWYSVLLPMRQTNIRAIPPESLAQAIKELGDSLLVIAQALHEKSKPSDSTGEVLKVVEYLLLESILTLYVLYGEDASVCNGICKACGNTVQYLMTKLLWGRYSAHSSCLVILWQLLRGITTASTVVSFWSRDKSKEPIGILLLDGLHFLLKSQSDPKVETRDSGLSSMWVLLYMTLEHCPLLCQNRNMVDLILKMYYQTSPSQKESWSTQEQ